MKQVVLCVIVDRQFSRIIRCIGGKFHFSTTIFINAAEVESLRKYFFSLKRMASLALGGVSSGPPTRNPTFSFFASTAELADFLEEDDTDLLCGNSDFNPQEDYKIAQSKKKKPKKTKKKISAKQWKALKLAATICAILFMGALFISTCGVFAGIFLRWWRVNRLYAQMDL